MSVTGWAKGASYKPGEHVTSEPANHSWNAVYIDGNWFLLDCHWATRHDESVDVKYDYDDFYFLTDPAEMIYSHFPENTGWQLLQSPWTGGTFMLVASVCLPAMILLREICLAKLWSCCAFLSASLYVSIRGAY